MKKKIKQTNISKLKTINYKIFDIFIYFILFLLLILPLWLNKKFGFLYFEQFKFNLTLLYYGYLDGDSNLVNSAIKWLIVVPLILSLIYTYIKIIINFLNVNKEKSFDYVIKQIRFLKKNFYNFNINILFKFFNFFLNRFFYLVLTILIFIFFYKFTNFHLKPEQVSKVEYLDLNYVYPDVSNTGDKNNLVILYVESLENSYSDKKIFNENLIKELSDIKSGKSVKYFYQIPGLGYTFSSLVSTQCGIPLLQITKSYIDVKDLKGINKFLPNLTCLTDILADYGYENIFLSSDYLENSLTDRFLLSHNYTEMYGLKELTEMGYQTSKKAYHNKNEWSGGIHDNVLLDASIDILKNLAKSDKNFFMSIMTLDSHTPAGTPNPACLKNQIDQKNLNNWTIKETIKCTSIYVSDFINKFNKLKLENTKLILIGDHLLMQDIGVDNRYIYNKFFINDNFSFKRNYINFFDFYPSFLEVMKFHINNKKGKVALGYSIFRQNDDYKLINFSLKGSSKLYDSFWQIQTE